MSNVNIATILAYYYQTLSIEKVEEFINSLRQAEQAAEKTKVSDVAQVAQNNNDVQIDKTVNSVQSNPCEYKDFEILRYIANSINLYTGEIITGIDECLQERLLRIAEQMEESGWKENTEPLTPYDIVKYTINLCEKISKVSSFGIGSLVDVLRGSKNKKILAHKLNKLEGYGILQGVEKKRVNRFIVFLLEEGFFYREKGLYPAIKISKNKTIEDIEDIDFSKVEEILGLHYEGEQSNAGRRWTKEEEQRLIEEFKQGLSIAEIAKRHNRKRGGIRSRLDKLGL